MIVVATAGHVDHGKSTLVRALTGMEPDRWAEEHRRGMTIDLGYAWTPLDHPDGRLLAFVDVPGHQRFIGNMLAGLGPVSAIMFVVAADEGWQPQSSEHLSAIDALGLSHGLLAVTRSDLADPAPAEAEARRRLGSSSLGAVESVVVSGRTGAGLPHLRAALGRLATRLPSPPPDGPMRLWVDRSFTVMGSGTVVTGTLNGGRISVGDQLEIGSGRHRVRGLQQAGVAVTRADAVGRVAVNLGGVSAQEVGRGDALLSIGDWNLSSTIDVGLSVDAVTVAGQLMLHVGTAAVAVSVRPLSGRLARLRLHRPLPLRAGDRAILRDPGAQRIVAGLDVLATGPAELRRRGAAERRAAELLSEPDPDEPAARQRELQRRLVEAVDAHATSRPLEPGLPEPAALRALGLVDTAELRALAAAAGLAASGGRINRAGLLPSLGAAEAGLSELEERLARRPFAAPEQPELQGLGLGRRELAAAVRLGRLQQLSDGVYLLPSAPALAMRELAGLAQPFTTSQARVALQTTRRVVIPLLEHLDERGWTERVDAGHRQVRR